MQGIMGFSHIEALTKKHNKLNITIVWEESKNTYLCWWHVYLSHAYSRIKIKGNIRVNAYDMSIAPNYPDREN